MFVWTNCHISRRTCRGRSRMYLCSRGGATSTLHSLMWTSFRTSTAKVGGINFSVGQERVMLQGSGASPTRGSRGKPYPGVRIGPNPGVKQAPPVAQVASSSGKCKFKWQVLPRSQGWAYPGVSQQAGPTLGVRLQGPTPPPTHTHLAPPPRYSQVWDSGATCGPSRGV